MGYRNPTLVETFVEVYLQPDTLSEGRFFEVVPRLQALGFSDVELAPAGFEFPSVTPFPRPKQRVRCWRPGRQALVQVGEDLLVVNLTGPYPGWDPFIQLFDQGLSALDAIAGYQVKSLNLQTIDRFQAPQNGFSAEAYLNVGGRLIPHWFDGCRESFDMNLGHGYLEQDGRNRRVAVAVRTNTDPVTIEIQAAFHDAIDEGVALRPRLEQLHTESVAAFEALITDRTRNEIMGGRA